VVLHCSAKVAILWGEPESARFVQAVGVAPVLQMSVATRLEPHLVLAFQPRAVSGAVLSRDQTGCILEPVTEAQLALAIMAFDRFGKGRHPAGLTFGDCFSYALSRTMSEPLLFKGNEFGRTDVTRAL
jgi:ribonuclease VapC